MSLPHRAPTGALRTQAGVKRSETPVKRSRQQNRVPKERQKFCRPYRGFNMFMHPMQGFRFAAPPACVLSPLSGLQFVHTSYAGVPLRCTTCLCSVRPYRGLQYTHTSFAGVSLRSTTCLCSVAPIGASICSYILCRGSASLHHLPVFYRPYRGLQ